MTEFQPTMLKALFSQLVDGVRTQEAAAAYLSISRQRVSQIMSAHPDNAKELPTWAQVFKLEQACGQSIVFGALARMIEGDDGKGAMAAAVASTAAATAALQAVHAAKADGVVETHEIDPIRDAARQNLIAAQRQFDEAMKLAPGVSA